MAASDSLTIVAELLRAQAEAQGLRRVRMKERLWDIRMGITYRTQIAEFAPLKGLLDAVCH